MSLSETQIELTSDSCVAIEWNEVRAATRSKPYVHDRCFCAAASMTGCSARCCVSRGVVHVAVESTSLLLSGCGLTASEAAGKAVRLLVVLETLHRL